MKAVSSVCVCVCVCVFVSMTVLIYCMRAADYLFAWLSVLSFMSTNASVHPCQDVFLQSTHSDDFDRHANITLASGSSAVTLLLLQSASLLFVINVNDFVLKCSEFLNAQSVILPVVSWSKLQQKVFQCVVYVEVLVFYYVKKL